MATEVYIDRIDTLSTTEVRGIVTEVIRKVFVRGLTGVDWSILLDVLDDNDVPQYGEELTTGVGGSNVSKKRYKHLVVVNRNVQMTDKDSAEVTLTYSRFNDHGQFLYTDKSPRSNKIVSGKMTVSVSQKTTNKYKENGKGNDITIVLEHTYPTADPDYGGKTIKQTGEITINQPQRNFVIEGIKETKTPWTIADSLVGNINNDTWMGKVKHTWLCVEVTWDRLDETHYAMTFGFQHNPDTWNPDAIFIDDRTNRPPEGLVKNKGYKSIRYCTEVDFERKLGFYCLGPD